jgi:hypothetical protein
LISAVLGPLGPRITIYIGTSHRRSNEPSLKYNTSLRKVVRARLLNRDVPVVLSYQICKDILSTEESTLESGTSIVTDQDGNNPNPATFSAHLAYRELMSDFFPLPNLLIEGFPAHTQRRKQWESSFAQLPEDASSRVRDLSIEFFNSLVLESEIDLYSLPEIASLLGRQIADCGRHLPSTN